MSAEAEGQEQTASAGDPAGGRGPLLGIVALVALVPALAWLPYRFPPAPGSASASAAVGYGNFAAFVIAASWCLIVVAVFAFAERRGWLGAIGAARPSAIASPSGSVPWFEIGFVLVCFVLLYFPPFLARRGPFVEDQYFLTALHRMDGGLVPYRDLETVYGPLMLYLPHYWLQLFGGFSARSYYAFLATLEALSFGVLLWLVGQHYRRFATRWLAFAVLGVFLFNTLLGVSWNGARRILPLWILWNAAVAPKDPRRIAAGGVGLGILLAWSHDFAALTVAGLGAVALVSAWSERSFAPILRLIAQGALAGVLWLSLSALLLGAALPDYLVHAVFSAGRFAREASFPFHWTGHSLSTFAFLGLGFALAGSVLARRGALASGDRLLIAAVAYALLALSSGLNRADMWHIASVPLPLMLFFLAPLPRARCADTPRLRRTAFALIALQVLTYAPAMLPSGSYYATGLLRGAQDVLTGTPLAAPDMLARHPTILRERTEVSEAEIELAAWLAAPAQMERPVLFYGWVWGLDKYVGVRKMGFPTDDFLLSDEYGFELRRGLEESPDALVIMRATDLEWLQAGLAGTPRSTPVIWPDSATKRILRWLSTIHYVGGPLELEQKNQRWERTVGGWLVSEWVVIGEFGNYRVLARPVPGTAP